jgi:hypothetical protein
VARLRRRRGFLARPGQPESEPDPDDPVNWRASSSPADRRDATIPGQHPAIWINEILTHTDPPAVDTIELHNPNPFPVDVGHWYLTDRRTEPQKFRIPAPR